MYLRVQSAVQKTAEELKKQQVRDAEERQKYLASRVPQLNIDGLDQCKQTTDTVSQKLAYMPIGLMLHVAGTNFDTFW